jgi:hypothetical protein
MGLDSSTIRSYGSHECCGKHLCVGAFVRLRLVILEGDGDGQYTDNMMKVIKIKDGTEYCYAGSLQWYITKRARKEELMNAYDQVILVYTDSTIEMMKRKNKHLLDTAPFHILSDMQITE